MHQCACERVFAPPNPRARVCEREGGVSKRITGKIGYWWNKLHCKVQGWKIYENLNRN